MQGKYDRVLKIKRVKKRALKERISKDVESLQYKKP